MRKDEVKVGQVVKHREGFVAVVEEIKDVYNVHLKIIDVSTSEYRKKGDTYIGLAENLTLLVDVKQPTSNKMTIEVEVTGLDQLEKVLELDKEESIFAVSIGDGITFEGSESDFKVFMDEMKDFIQFDHDLKNKYTF